MTDTCPVDNFLAILFAVANDENPRLLSHLLKSADVAESALGRMLAEVQKGNVGVAKDIWASFLLDRAAGVAWQPDGSLSFWGGQVEMFLVFFRKVYAVSYVTECSNGPLVCPNFSCVVESRSLLKIKSPLWDSQNDTQSQLDWQLRDRVSHQCHAPVISSQFADVNRLNEHTRLAEVVFDVEDSEEGTPQMGRVCNGQCTMKQLHVSQDCWMIPLDICGLQETEVFSLADEIEICGKRFRLRGIILFSAFLKHFFAFVRRSSGWYHYCGIFDPAGSLVVGVPVTDGKPEIALYTL